ncbi:MULTISPECIES: AraC family transcriptional regulator [Gammaproteobacteria]|uniref:Transcriptional regulator n=1 Tax=Xanthomonas boreopolis TaxID=86183 RepID=A0A919F6L8_9XANT|nr:AraC family transcriptional regulator [Pseudomonas sp. Hp2]GHH49339.1 transcriptional regulator [[Pseudomonas] boreopolis]
MNTLSPSELIAQHSLAAPLAELTDRIARLTAGGEGFHRTALPALHLIRFDAPTACMPTVYEPRLCLVVQGSKLAILGEQHYRYDPLHYLVVSVTLPMIGQVVEASPEKPYLCLRLDLAPEDIAGLLLDGPERAGDNEAGEDGACAAYAARVGTPLLDAVLRLMRLLDAPEDLRVLAPLAIREILYRVLQGDLGGRLRALAVKDGQHQRVAQAVMLLRRHYLEPLRVEALARTVHMSVSALHRGFKAATSMSPLQYQKQLRLHEARRLMLVDGLEAAAAAHRVGYESPSQFSREYKRLFGAPPRAEVMAVRTASR